MPPEVEGFLGTEWMSNDFYKLIFRFVVNMFFLTIVIRFIYYRKTKMQDYLFTFYMISTIVFMICFALKKLDIDTGMGLGLFAIFGIIRYRTITVRIKEMTYIFICIGLSVVNSLSGKQVSYAELLFINIGTVALVYALEYIWLKRAETAKIIVYEKIELVKPEKFEELKADLESRTGLKIKRIQVGKIDYLRDTARLRIYFQEDSQDEFYPEDYGSY